MTLRLPTFSWTAAGRFEWIRAIGLGVLNEVWKPRREAPEPKKPIARNSWWLAFQRCFIHLLPVGGSAVMIAFNLNGLFIGAELAGIPGQTTISLALLQVAAKIQELLIVSSLAAVVFHKTRHDLLDGAGVPFGLLGSGLSFAQLSYFWSMEFWGGLRKSNVWLVSLLLVSGLVSLTAGPSVAVLIIPRTVTWPAGGVTFWLNGTAKELWPSSVDMEHHPSACFSNSTSSIEPGGESESSYLSALCPYGGFYALKDHFASANSFGQQLPLSLSSFLQSQRMRADGSPDTFAPSGIGILVKSRYGLVVPFTLTGSVKAWNAIDTATYGIHGATANLQQRLDEEWFKTIDGFTGTFYSKDRLRFYAGQLSRVGTRIPAVRVGCSSGKFSPHNSTVEVGFPVLPTFDQMNRSRYGQGATDVYWPLTQLPELSNVNSSTAPRVHWMNMSSDPVNGWSATTGVVFESPWINSTALSGTGRYVTGCTVDARWADGSTITQERQAIQAELSHLAERVHWQRTNDKFRPIKGSWSEIKISDTWLDTLNFELPDAELGSLPQGTRALEALIAATNLVYDDRNMDDNRPDAPNSLSVVENVIASAIADGLSRVASFRSLNLTQPLYTSNNSYVYFQREPDAGERFFDNGSVLVTPDAGQTVTPFKLEESVTGYGYKARSITDILALGVLFLHIAVASAHMAYMLITRRSSGCWDTLCEIIALAMQSVPSKLALRNTCAGIHRMNNFGERLWVRAADDNMEHLELVFEADGSETTAFRIDPTLKYGDIKRRA